MGLLRQTFIVATVVVLSGCGAFGPREAEAPAAVSAPDGQQPVAPVCPQAPTCECVSEVTEPVVVAPVPVCAPAAVAPGEYGELTVLGALEWAAIGSDGLRAKARLDTGATSSSIHATNIVQFERDGKSWVRFEFVPHDGEGAGQVTKFEKPVQRRVRIKRHDADSQRRYVVKMRLGIGKISEKIEVTLNDRSEFKYSVLIGRNFLTDNAVVDVSRQFAAD